MKIVADKHRLRVDYKAAGKFYNATGSEANPTDDGKHSSYAFDSQDVEIGQTFEVPGTLVRVVEYLPTGESVGTGDAANL